MEKAIGAEQRLLELGREALARGGIRGLRVRRLCEEAGVSPGTFTSFFGTRKHFADRLLEQWYEEMKNAIRPHRQQAGTAYERLRAELAAALRFAGANAGILLQLMQDIGAGEASARALIPVAELNHLSWLRQAIVEAQAEGSILPGEPADLLIYIIGAVNMPIAISRLVNLPLRDGRVQTLISRSVSEEACLQRLDWALAGIRVQKGGAA